MGPVPATWLAARPQGWLLLVVACVACAAPARAQIYSWRDASGNLVLSNRRSRAPGGQDDRVVHRAEGRRRSARPAFVAADRGGVYDDLIAEQRALNGVRADLVRAVDAGRIRRSTRTRDRRKARWV